jgi:hypothetical protein
MRWHDVPIAVGLWGMTVDLDRPRQRLQAVGASELCTSFAECIAQLEIRFANGKRADRTVADHPQAAESPT